MALPPSSSTSFIQLSLVLSFESQRGVGVAYSQLYVLRHVLVLLLCLGFSSEEEEEEEEELGGCRPWL